MNPTLPYRIAVLCYLFDQQGRLLLLHRAQQPNRGLYSPIGGKLRMDRGESPACCALREIREEVLLDLDDADLRLAGLVSETAFQGQGHWLLFLYEVTHPVAVERMSFEEGQLGWFTWEQIDHLSIPQTDRQVIFPMFRRYRDRFFHVHIDCTHDSFTWRVEALTGSSDSAGDA